MQFDLMDEYVEEYIQDVIKKELEFDIDAFRQIREDGPLSRRKVQYHIRRRALEEIYRRIFGESYVSKPKEASSD